MSVKEVSGGGSIGTTVVQEPPTKWVVLTVAFAALSIVSSVFAYLVSQGTLNLGDLSADLLGEIAGGSAGIAMFSALRFHSLNKPPHKEEEVVVVVHEGQPPVVASNSSEELEKLANSGGSLVGATESEFSALPFHSLNKPPHKAEEEEVVVVHEGQPPVVERESDKASVVHEGQPPVVASNSSEELEKLANSGGSLVGATESEFSALPFHSLNKPPHKAEEEEEVVVVHEGQPPVVERESDKASVVHEGQPPVVASNSSEELEKLANSGGSSVGATESDKWPQDAMKSEVQKIVGTLFPGLNPVTLTVREALAQLKALKE